MTARKPNQETGLARPALRALNDHPDDGRALDCLLERTFVAPENTRPRRREELIVLAEDRLGMPRAEAEEVYDVAREEGLEPALAFELVRCGLAVCDFEVPDAEPIVDIGEPEWVDTPPPAAPERERRLRTSFRRLRGLVEENGSPEDALAAFVREPDVDDCGYEDRLSR